MGRVRKTSRLSKSKGKINTTAYGKRNKRKYNKEGYTVKMSNIRERWNKTLSLKTNLSNLGLVYDINSDIKPFGKRSRKDKKGQSEEIEFMDITEATAANSSSSLVPPPTLTGSLIGMEEEMEENDHHKRLKNKKAVSLHEEFVTRSKRRFRKTCHLSTLEVEHLLPLIQKHGTDYTRMYRDKANTDQLTENQLRKKCEELLQSRETRHLKKFKELGLIK